MSAKIIAIHHHKGGVGKTSLAQNIATVLSRGNRRVMAIDTDGQANLSAAFGVFDQGKISSMLNAEMAREDHSDQSIRVSDYLTLLSADHKLYHTVEEIANFRGNRIEILKDTIQPYSHRYDYIIIDTPPNATWLVYAALYYADMIISPVQLEAFAVDGILSLQKTLDTISKEIKYEIKINKFVPTFFDKRKKEHSSYLTQLRSAYNGRITDTIISTDANIPKSQTQCKSVIDIKTRANAEYVTLTKELFNL